MIDGIYGRVTEWSTRRDVLSWTASWGSDIKDIVMGPWKSKVTIEFDGPIPEWLQKTLQDKAGRVRILP